MSETVIPAEYLTGKKVKIFMTGHPTHVYAGRIIYAAQDELLILDRIDGQKLIRRNEIKDMNFIPEENT